MVGSGENVKRCATSGKFFVKILEFIVISNATFIGTTESQTIYEFILYGFCVLKKYFFMLFENLKFAEKLMKYF